MKEIFKRTMFIVLIFYSVNLQSTEANNFRFPMDNYNIKDSCLDWGGLNSAFLDENNNPKKHVGDDFCAPTGTPVRAVANGIVKFVYNDPTNTERPRGWYALVVIEHPLFTGGKVYGIYGHVKPSVQKDQSVSVGDIIGYIVDYPPSSEHIHFGIYSGQYVESGGKPGSWLVGYLPQGEWSGSYFDPIKFILDNSSIARTSNNIFNQTIHDAYISNGGYSKLGLPFSDHGGTQFVHNWSDVWIQNFQHPNCQGTTCSASTTGKTPYGIDGQTAIIYNPKTNQAFLVREGFWGIYKQNNGPEILGPPTSDEYSFNRRNSPPACCGGRRATQYVI